MNFSKKTITYLEGGNRDLQFILTKVKILEEISRRVVVYLDPAIVNFCQVANFSNNRLIILVPDGSIATQIRFQTSDLLRRFRGDSDPRLQKIEEIHCKVSPHFAKTAAKSPKKRPNMQAPSPETADIIRGIAECVEDPALKEVLERIAGRGK